MAIEFETAQAKQKTAVKMPKLRLSLLKRSSVIPRDRMFFVEQLALLLETGSTLHEALKILRRQTDNPAMNDVIDSLILDISQGRSFSNAMSRYPHVFSTTYVNLIGASEKGGFMHEVLKQLLGMEQKREELKSTMLSAFSYPAFLMTFSLLVVVFVLLVVFPKFGDLFLRIEDQLPITTKVLMSASQFLQTYWAHTCVVVAVGVFFLRQWLVSPAGSYWLDAIKLRVPVLRDVFVQLYVIQSMRVMGLSLANGVTVVDTLKGCREVVSNRVFQNMIADVEIQVQQGNGIAAGFRQKKFMPSIVRQMIATGEETGSLAVVMERIADFYEKSLNKKLAAVARIIEPVMLLVMGVVVGVIVSSLILPIFKLSRAVS